MERLAARLESQGWSVGLTRNGHYKAKAPDGTSLYFFPSTPSDYRTTRNCISDLRKLGAKL